MTTPVRKTALATLKAARQSKLRRPIMHALVWTHNTSYHLISFFASHTGIHPKHKILNYHQFFLDNIKKEDSVLDIGSGNGAVAFDIAQKAKQVVGIDIRKTNVDKASATFHHPSLEFIHGDATTHSFKKEFDAIILSNVLEHIEHRIDFLKSIANIAPKILIRVPMLSRDWVSVYKKEAGFEYRLDDTHHIEYTEKTFKEEVGKAGLKITHFHTAFGEIYAVCERG